MGYRTILLNLQDPKRSEAIVQAGIGLARKFEAHLVGLYVVPKVQYFYATAAIQVATEVFEAEQRFFDEQAQKNKEIFEREVPGDVVSEWRSIQADGVVTTDSIVEQAICADLVLTGQIDPEEGMEGDIGTPERLVMESGRPVLVIPYAGRFESIGDNVLVAWNGSREAARATFDALPLLNKARSVKLLWANPETEDGGNGNGMPGSEMASTLSRHDIKVEAGHSATRDVGVGDELLSRAADQGADLLVMGAYGHSRVREYVFGGATRHILQHMTVPTLLSH
ncbi:MAG TPA: universal stress protein [Hyphomicrobiales bacterium]|nr:universal stress protein [Hyphomicrobiales bacterium]